MIEHRAAGAGNEGMSKPLKVAGEVDSYCTSCRMMLNHRIVSMVGPKPHQVLCLTCNKGHLYKAHPPGQKPEPAGRVVRAGNDGPRPARVSSATRAEQARVGREQTWEKANAGKAMGEFKAYSVAAIFTEGDLLRHKKFGDGVVTRVVDPQKIEVLFRDEPRTLAHGLKA
jgi:hypothetical protein